MRLPHWVFLATATLLLGAHHLASRFHIGINVTPSLPGHVYVIDKTDRSIERDTLIAFRWTGAAPIPRDLTVIKIVKGVAGDLVTVRDRDIFINGRFLAHAKPLTRTGEALTPLPSGLIPAGHVFVFASHPDSYDSRYTALGLVPENAIIGRAKEWF